jgi:hypothetical protein
MVRDADWPRGSLRILPIVVGAVVVTAGLAANPPGRVEPGSELRTGEYTWHPEVSPKGPVLVVISLPQQRAYVYRNGVLIGRSTISSGRRGHETPTGVFTVLQKKRKHESNLYKGAQMPNMQRLTWSGIALHAGKLPGYADSHGCVRLPREFSRLLYDVTGMGTTVVVADDASDSALVAHPGALMAEPAMMKRVEPADLTRAGFTWHPERAAQGPVTIVVSGADRRMWVFRNGQPVGHASLTFAAEDYTLPRGVFSYVGEKNGHRQWVGAGLDAATADSRLAELRTRVAVAPEFLAAVQGILQPGTTLCITPRSVLPPSVTSTPVE